MTYNKFIVKLRFDCNHLEVKDYNYFVKTIKQIDKFLEDEDNLLDSDISELKSKREDVINAMPYLLKKSYLNLFDNG